MSETKLVPTFIIHFNGKRLPAERRSEVKEIVVADRINAPSKFNIIAVDPGGEWIKNSDYAEGAEVFIRLGYKENLKEVFTGEVTGVALQVKKNRERRVIISGYNLMHRICRQQKILAYSHMTDRDIIEQIACGAGLLSDIESLTKEHLFFLHRDIKDYEILLELADKYNCHFWVFGKKMFFKRLKKNSGEDMVLEYGKTIKALYPTIDSSGIVSEVEVRGWDYTKREPIVGTAIYSDIKPVERDMVHDNWGGSKKTWIDYTVNDQAEADKMALDILIDNSRGNVKGYGFIEGTPTVLAGIILKLEGLGKQFSGKYLVTGATHSFDSLGAYETRMDFTSAIASGSIIKPRPLS